MKKLFLIICTSIFSSVYSQWVVQDPSVATLLNVLNKEQTISNSKTIAQAASTVKLLQSQGKWIKENIEKVDNAVKTLNVVTDIQKNAVGVVSDYRNTSNALKAYKNLNPQYIQNALNRLANIVNNNKKTVQFFSSIMKSDFLKLSSYERIKLLNEINEKLTGLKEEIYSIGAEAYNKNATIEVNHAIYSLPILK